METIFSIEDYSGQNHWVLSPSLKKLVSHLYLWVQCVFEEYTLETQFQNSMLMSLTTAPVSWYLLSLTSYL